MTTAEKQPDPDTRMKRDMRANLDALIAEQILYTLGEPSTLIRVQVRRLWTDYYRANVFVGADAVSARIAHSYFLAIDAEGKIIESVPKITRHY